jgi:hypothetical protein
MQGGHFLFFSLLFLLLPLSAASQSHPDLPLMPPSGIVQGWARGESPLFFAGSNLYGHIDGGAELFLEFGFEELTVQYYGNGNEEIAIELYRMKDIEAAWGIYLMKCGKEIQDPSFHCRHTLSQFQLLGVQDRYYFQANNLEGKENGRKVMLALARELSSRLPEGKSWEIPAWFEQGGLLKDSLRIIRGPFALEPLYTLGEGDLLQLKHQNIALAGRFQDSQEKTSLKIIASYPDEKETSAAFHYFRAHLDPSISVIREDENEFIFKDYEGKFGKCARKKTQIEIRTGLLQHPSLHTTDSPRLEK